jgi:hypothetical protein
MKMANRRPHRLTLSNGEVLADIVLAFLLVVSVSLLAALSIWGRRQTFEVRRVELRSYHIEQQLLSEYSELSLKVSSTCSWGSDR